MDRTELVILKHLINDEDYARRTIPYLKSEYFRERTDKVVYEEIDKFINKYNSLPSKEALVIELDNNSNINDEEFSVCSRLITDLSSDNEETDKQWLIEKTEKFCQERAIYNAITESISIID